MLITSILEEKLYNTYKLNLKMFYISMLYFKPSNKHNNKNLRTYIILICFSQIDAKIYKKFIRTTQSFNTKILSQL